MRRLFAHIVVLIASLAWIDRAQAIGWDSNDFLIGGGSSFTDRIGVFDHDLTFKGYLDSNFVGTAGMDFDAGGNLVAVSWARNEVRRYATDGALVGGFSRPDGALASSGYLGVAPDGSYVIGQGGQLSADGVRRFSPQGDFLQQYGSGKLASMTLVPGNLIWAWGPPGGSGVRVFDLTGGVQVATITLANVHAPNSMRFSGATNSVLVVDVTASAVVELGLDGSFIRKFDAPGVVALEAADRGPNGDVFATTGGSSSILRWRADGQFVGSTSTSASIGGASAIVWAGNVPEASSSLAVLFLLGRVATLRQRHNRFRSASSN